MWKPVYDHIFTLKKIRLVLHVDYNILKKSRFDLQKEPVQPLFLLYN